jgi:ubiquinone/menaquinone biosynthesis C-methylase UbiE
MSRAALIATFLREMMTRERVPRIPEPDLVMDDPEKVAAYTRAGREDGVMAPVYLFHCAQICEIIRPGEKVVDLGCGPATQLAMVARLNPDNDFIGVDLSEEMLGRAHDHVRALGLKNVEFITGDITDLNFLDNGSVGAVFSTVVAHHLPNIDHLYKMIAETGRILKSGGGVYVVDFTRLKSEKSIQYFGNQYADRQPALFTTDYLNSLRAAFTLEDFEAAIERHLKGRAKVYSTFMMPYMAAVKTPSRNSGTEELRKTLKNLQTSLPKHHREDLRNLIMMFQLNGLKSRML